VGAAYQRANAVNGIRLKQFIGDSLRTLSIKSNRRSSDPYALGYTNSEHQRLMRQAALIAPVTERLFREAGIGVGHRVLDLGSGLGDVSMLLARLVGPSGEVVGIERDGTSIERAHDRVAAAGFRNVHFIQTDVNQLASDKPFDAAVGRFILMFLPDPVSVLRSVAQLVRSGGVLAFQEPSWIPMLALGDRLPLWSCVLRWIHETLLRSGANPEMGLALYPIFQEVGLPAPKMHLEIPLGSKVDFLRVIADLVCSLEPLAAQHGVPLEELGKLETLPERLCAEITSANTVVSVVPLLGGWSRKPTNTSDSGKLETAKEHAEHIEKVSAQAAANKSVAANSQEGNNVSVIDTANDTVVATIPVGTLPLRLAVSPDGERVYVTNNSSNDVSVIDTSNNQVLATVPVGTQPMGVAVGPDGARAYAANGFSNDVSVIDTVNNVVVATVPVGSLPFGVAVTPDGARVYVTNYIGGNVSVIDTSNNQVVATVPVGGAPGSFGDFISTVPCSSPIPTPTPTPAASATPTASGTVTPTPHPHPTPRPPPTPPPQR
jgi:YVTN family beta-propeller protein